MAFGHETHNPGSNDESNEIANGRDYRALHGQAARSVRVEGQPRRAHHDVEQLRSSATVRAEHSAGEQDSECLAGKWHGSKAERDRDLRRGSSEKRKSDYDRVSNIRLWDDVEEYSRVHGILRGQCSHLGWSPISEKTASPIEQRSENSHDVAGVTSSRR